jgi:membrane protease YdiL (CAAX protease family)
MHSTPQSEDEHTLMPAPQQRSATSTTDAWALLCVAAGLYVVSQLFLTKFSILGGTAVGQVLSFLVPSLLYAKWKSGAVRDALRLRPVPPGLVVRVALLALTFAGVSDLLQQATRPVLTQYFADFVPMLQALMEILSPKSAAGLAGNLVVVGLIAPVCEEVLFRGAFQGTLERRGPVRAILASTLVFASVHLNPFAFLDIVLIGVALGYVTWRTQSLWPAMIWHVLNNAAATLAMGLGGESFSLPLWADALLAVAFIALAAEFVRHTRREVAPPPGLLALAPPLLAGRTRRWSTAIGLAIVVPLVAAAICLGRARLGNDLLAPEFSRDDIVVYTRGPAFRPDALQVRDAILYRDAGGGLRASRILEIAGGRIAVLGRPTGDGQPSTVQLAREDLRGKIVWAFDPGAEVKRLLRQIEDRRQPAKQPGSP